MLQNPIKSSSVRVLQQNPAWGILHFALSAPETNLVQSASHFMSEWFACSAVSLSLHICKLVIGCGFLTCMNFTRWGRSCAITRRILLDNSSNSQNRSCDFSTRLTALLVLSASSRHLVMNPQDIVEPITTKPPQHSQGSRVSRGETWNSCKDEIYRVYMTEQNTLPKTMEIFEREYGLKAWWVLWIWAENLYLVPIHTKLLIMNLVHVPGKQSSRNGDSKNIWLIKRRPL